MNTPTTKDQLNYTATQDQLAIFSKFNPTSEETFPFKYKPRTFWNESDSDVDYSDDEETIDDLMRKLELKYQITWWMKYWLIYRLIEQFFKIYSPNTGQIKKNKKIINNK